MTQSARFVPEYWTPAEREAYEESTRHLRKVRLGSDTPRHDKFRRNPRNIEAVVFLDDSPSMLQPAEIVALIKSQRSNRAKWDKLIELKLANKIRGLDWDRREYNTETESDTPPKIATLLILLIPKKNREHVLGDLDEEYRTILVPRYGRRTAKTWYWWHVAISIGPLLWAQIKRAAAIAWLWKHVR